MINIILTFVVTFVVVVTLINNHGKILETDEYKNNEEDYKCVEITFDDIWGMKNNTFCLRINSNKDLMYAM